MMSDQWQPQPSGGAPQPLPTPEPKRSNERWYAIVGGMVAVLAGLAAVLTGAISFGGTSDALEITEEPLPAPVFEAAAAEGADPFFPLNDQLNMAAAQPGGEMPDEAAVASGLYGGTAENTCDPQRLIDYLMANPEKGQAWAHVQGIEYEQIPDYINSLSVRVLADSAVVLNHGFDAETGEPYEIETTLEAGTAVLVDDNGDIRTRCYCGNPIKPKLVGHKPPRCVATPSLIVAEPGSDHPVPAAPTDVTLTGRVTTGGEWTEVSWGPGAGQSGWTPTTNLSKNLCFPGAIVPPLRPPTPVETVEPTPEQPTPTPTEEPGATPEPIPTVQPTPTPRPEPTPTRPPATPTPTPELIQPFQPFCGVSKNNVAVGEEFEISGGHVPDSVSVSWSFDHGDGTIDPRNPSIALYNAPGTYTVTGLADLGGGDVRRIPCGTVTATGGVVQVTCTIDDTQITVGETTVFRGSHTPAEAVVTYVFDHGDGYSEQANPSYAVYTQPGSYTVTLEAIYQGSPIDVTCGTVTVSPATSDGCSATGLVGLTEASATATAEARGCTVFVAQRCNDTFFRTQDYRTDRVNLTVNCSGFVTGASIG